MFCKYLSFRFKISLFFNLISLNSQECLNDQSAFYLKDFKSDELVKSLLAYLLKT